MKKLLMFALFLSLSATLASAEILTIANPIGQGKIGVLGAYMQDQNYSNVSGATLASFGGYVGYGVIENLDVLIQAGSATANGLPFSSSVTGYGAILKYTVVNEGPVLPVSVAVGTGYKFLAATAAGASMNGNQAVAAVGVSKMMIPFIPYGGIAYRKSTLAAANLSSQMDITVGTAIAWSAQGAVMVEYTVQSVSPAGGANYSSGQMAAGVAYRI
ncbi:hypothetical protein HZC35_01780 [Candidatus Saganbacteria bacterium]|nr:hypothetical protein [Candidatus Saganbacteria bacterium]